MFSRMTTIALAVTLAGTVFFCKHAPKITKAFVLNFIGEVQLVNAQKEARKPEIKAGVDESDTVQTGEKSEITIQLRDTGVVRVFEKTEVLFKAIAQNGTNTDISLANGAIFSKIKKLTADKKYRITTPTLTIAIRGTEFLTEYSDEKKETTISVKEGEIVITLLKAAVAAPQEIPVKQGETVTIDKDQKVRRGPTMSIRAAELEKYSLHHYLDNLDAMTIEQIKEHFRKLKLAEDEIDKKIEFLKELAKLSPLDRLRKLGKRITMFHMKDGSKIAGNVVSQDALNITIDTGDGIITIGKNDFRRREDIK
ncbi:MAG TPA: FecR family protein [Spirochaetota bacterium]|nr:FecR family protein [Spirochaetota bacterium]HOS41674.1 FecR family protein [Spirochaetota bacterium]HPU87942.1 FecR family protein [Spirochaetota bacterium]